MVQVEARRLLTALVLLAACDAKQSDEGRVQRRAPEVAGAPAPGAGDAAPAPAYVRAAEVTPSSKAWQPEDVVAASLVILDALAVIAEHHRDDCAVVSAELEESLGALLAQREVVATIPRSPAVQDHIRRELKRSSSALSKARDRALAPIRDRCPAASARIAEAAGLAPFWATR